MSDRLDQLVFLPPPASTPWSGSAMESTQTEVVRRDGARLRIDLPLFWYDPPWQHLNANTADVVAIAVAQRGVIVSALRRDLANVEGHSGFHGGQPQDGTGSDKDAIPLPRMLPYRPERYGLSDQDFDHATVIDVRLTMSRDPSGRFAFSQAQIERWEATQEGEPLAGGGWVPAATFPPDVLSFKHLGSKLDQLRVLSPTAAVFVSIGPYRWKQELAEVLTSNPDGVILRCDELTLDGFKLANLVFHAREAIEQSGASGLPLWVVPGHITPDDAVKLIALGASGVAIDRWCDDIISEAAGGGQSSAASRLGYGALSRGNQNHLYSVVQDELAAGIERFRGLLLSIGKLPPSQRLATLDEVWAKQLGLPAVQF